MKIVDGAAKSSRTSKADDCVPMGIADRVVAKLSGTWKKVSTKTNSPPVHVVAAW